jgi:hypothetical protein
MMKCMGCGEVLQEGEAVRAPIGFSEAWGSGVSEYGAVCPVCGYDIFEDCELCDCCGEALPEGEVSCGICEACLSEAFDFDEGKEYLQDIEDENAGWSDFVLSRVYGVIKCEDRAFLVDALPEPEADFICSSGKPAKEELKTYIFEDWKDYAERLYKTKRG